LFHASAAVCILSLGLFANSASSATTFSDAQNGTTAGEFLTIPVGSRGVGMGLAFTAVADGPEAMWWNPAGLLARTSNELLLESCSWMKDFLFNTVALRLPLDPGNTLGFMVNYLSFSIPMEGYDNTGIPTGPVPFGELAANLSFATTAFEVPFGFNIKLVSSKLDDAQAMTVAGDLGLRQGFFKDALTVGLAVKNIGGKLQYAEEAFALPFTIQGGTAWRLLNRDLTFSADVMASVDQAPHYHLGAELVRKLGMPMQLALRVGYHSDWRGYTDALNGLNAGLGCEYRSYTRVLARTGRMIGYKERLNFLVGLDYAWTPNTELEPTHRLALRLGF